MRRCACPIAALTLAFAALPAGALLCRSAAPREPPFYLRIQAGPARNKSA